MSRKITQQLKQMLSTVRSLTMLPVNMLRCETCCDLRTERKSPVDSSQWVRLLHISWDNAFDL